MMAGDVEWGVILKQALSMEDEGREYYLQAAGRVSFALGKKTFETLAEDELEHKRRIEVIYQILAGERGWPSKLPAAKEMSAAPSLFAAALKQIGSIRSETSDLEALNHALDLEKASWVFYQNQAEGAEDESAAEFFSRLAAEESEHYRLIEQTIVYLKQAWESFQEDEKPIFEGG